MAGECALDIFFKHTEHRGGISVYCFKAEVMAMDLFYFFKHFLADEKIFQSVKKFY
jgi:hypothetical protein